MEKSKVLIAYGTRYGCTQEISQEIGKVLEKKGLDIELINLGIINPINWPQLDNFGGLIIGTSLQINSWKKEVKMFLERKKDEIKSKNLKLGAFVCGVYPVAEPVKAKDQFIKKLSKKYDLEPDIYDAFGGILDLSEDTKVGKGAKVALKIVAKILSKNPNVEIKMNAYNDLRDWDNIRAFAESFAKIF